MLGKGREFVACGSVGGEMEGDGRWVGVGGGKDVGGCQGMVCTEHLERIVRSRGTELAEGG